MTIIKTAFIEAQLTEEQKVDLYQQAELN
jgi:hypothetical protein